MTQWSDTAPSSLVNITPETRDGAISWTITATRTGSEAIPFLDL